MKNNKEREDKIFQIITSHVPTDAQEVLYTQIEEIFSLNHQEKVEKSIFIVLNGSVSLGTFQETILLLRNVAQKMGENEFAEFLWYFYAQQQKVLQKKVTLCEL